MQTSRTYSVALAILMLGTANPADAQCRDDRDRRVSVLNDTSTTLVQLYGSDIGAETWEEDVLGDGVIRPGEAVRVDWDDGTCGCVFDFKAVFSDGEEVIKRSYNVCRGSRWRIYD